jgi:eukaryotic-like serine/threonine-protein kinase
MGLGPSVPAQGEARRFTLEEAAELAKEPTASLAQQEQGPGLAARPGRDPTPSLPIVRTLVLAELGTESHASGSPRFVATEAAHHHRVVREALAHFGGSESEGVERGALWLFERPTDAVGFALAYQQTVSQLARAQGQALVARVAVHLGEVVVHPNTPERMARTGRPFVASGLPTLVCARILALALPCQTLITRTAFDLARQPVTRGPLAGVELQWLAHGTYAVHGLEQPVALFEVGTRGTAPLRTPPDIQGGKRLVTTQDEPTLGWRPATGQAIPQRPNWTLRERLGQGGFGEVWLAVHPSGEKRVFKFCFEAARLRALKREITLVRLLEGALGQRHDIARVLDWDVSSAPYFIESEYTDGGDLVDWSDEQGGIAELPMTTRLSLMAEVADALAAAHSVGVLHKDIKPQNVLVTRDREGQPRARLADFGIGLVLDRELLGNPSLGGLGFTHTLATAASSLSGTPGYLAPELIEGKPPSIQADLYALGVMLYQAVAGDFSRTLAPGWQRDVEDPLLAQDIASLVDRAPERRPASAAEVAGKLRSLEGRREQLARAEQARRAALDAEQALRRAQARRRLAAVGAGLALLMLGVVSVFAWQTQAARERERMAREHAERRRAQAEKLIDFMLVDLRGKLQPLGKLAILDELGTRALDYFAAIPESELSDQELHSRAQALHQLGEVRVELGNLVEATQAFQEALRLSQSLAARAPGNAERQFDLGQSHFWVGYLLWQQKDLRNARTQFQAYLDVSEQLVVRDPRNPKWMLELAYAHSNMGSLALELEDQAAARTALRASSGIMETLLAQTPEDDDLRLQLAHVHAKLGELLSRSGELAGAAEWFEKYRAALQLLSEHAPEDMERLRFLAYAHSNLGDVLRQRGDVDGALAHFQKSLAITQRLVANDASNRALAEQLSLYKNKVAVIGVLRGRLDEAQALYAEERAAIEALLAHDRQRREWRFALARNHWSMASLQEARGRFPQALAQARGAVEILQELLLAEPTDRERTIFLAYSRWLLGHLHERVQALDKARTEWTQGLALVETLSQGSNAPFLYDVRVRLLLSLKRVDEARPLLATLSRMGYREPLLAGFLGEQGLPVEPVPRGSTGP